jgi:hypothetical protein
MEAAMIELLTQLLWPVVVLCIAILVCYGFVRWLDREAANVTTLKLELVELQRDWTAHFGKYEAVTEDRLRAIERRLNAERGQNPLGAHYDTRRPG